MAGRRDARGAFRAIFWVPEFKKLFQDLTPEEHEAINHRHRAIQNIAKKILQFS